MSCVTKIGYYTQPAEEAWHSHSSYQLVYFFQGSARMRIGEKSFNMQAPVAVFVSNLESHCMEYMSEDCCRYVVHIDPITAYDQLSDAAMLLSAFTDRPEDFRAAVQVPEGEVLAALLRLLLEEHLEGGSDVSQATILYNILHYLLRLSPESFPYPRQGEFPIARRIRRQFELDPAPAATLQDLAEEYNVSQSFLTHSLKKATGFSLGRYQMLCRLAKAKELLRTTQISVSDICYGCGFTDLSNFSRYFRREEGCSPSAYRAKQLPECVD